MRRALVTSAVVALALASQAAAATGARSIRYPIPGAGGSLAVPTSWRAVDSQTVLSSAAFKKLLAENPSLAGLLSQVTGPGSPLRFLALDPHPFESFTTNVNVVVTPAPASLTLVSGGSRRVVQTLQYLFLRNAKSIVVTFSTPPARAASYARTFDTIARSVRFP